MHHQWAPHHLPLSYFPHPHTNTPPLWRSLSDITFTAVGQYIRNTYVTVFRSLKTAPVKLHQSLLIVTTSSDPKCYRYWSQLSLIPTADVINALYIPTESKLCQVHLKVRINRKMLLVKCGSKHGREKWEKITSEIKNGLKNVIPTWFILERDSSADSMKTYTKLVKTKHMQQKAQRKKSLICISRQRYSSGWTIFAHQNT